MTELPVTTDFAAFYAERAPRVRRLLQRAGVSDTDVDDALQEAFVVIHRLLPGFEGRSSLETWLYAIVRRVAADYRRRMRSRPMPLEFEAATLAAARDASAHEGEALHAAWSALDADLRDLRVLHELGGLSISQLSALTGRARATIRQRLQQRRNRRGGASTAAEAPLSSTFAEGSTVIPHLCVLPSGQTCLSSGPRTSPPCAPSSVAATTTERQALPAAQIHTYPNFGSRPV